MPMRRNHRSIERWQYDNRIYTAPIDWPTVESDPLSCYTYRPLDRGDAKEIRLMHLHAANPNEPITCDLFHADLVENTQYEALSYAWATEGGDTSSSEVIRCSDRYLKITKNCFAALRRLRHKSMSRTLWVDAISIDQSNVQERNHQVGMMRDIYSNAEQVVIYLGESEYPLLWANRPGALRALLSRRWFSRVWVIQEYALAKKAVMVIGQGQMTLSKSYLARLSEQCRSNGIDMPAPFCWRPGGSRASCLLDALQSARRCSSTDPRDKIFALFGIVEDPVKSLVPIDYGRSVDETFIRAASAIILHSRQLHVLRYCFPYTKTRLQHLPSWVPDWADPSAENLVPVNLSTDVIGPWNRAMITEIVTYPEQTSNLLKHSQIILPSQSGKGYVRPHLIVRAHCIGAINGALKRSGEWPTAAALADSLKTIIRSQDRFPGWEALRIAGDLQWLIPRLSTSSRSTMASQFLSNPDIFRDLPLTAEILEKSGGGKCVFQVGSMPAMAPHGFEEGDTVWAIDGSRAFSILKEVGEGKYRIFSDCYLFPLHELDCWVPGSAQDEWDFDPFRMGVDTRWIEIY